MKGLIKGLIFVDFGRQEVGGTAGFFRNILANLALIRVF